MNSTAARLLGLLLLLTAIGCDHLSGPGSDPESARASVTSDADELSVTVVTSIRFDAVRQSDGGASVALVDSDTAVAPLPYDESFDIRSTGRFFVTVEAADTTGIPVTLQAFVDGTERFRRTVPVGEEPLTFIFRSR